MSKFGDGPLVYWPPGGAIQFIAKDVLTKRELLAAFAMQGLAANKGVAEALVNMGQRMPEAMAMTAVQIADALLKELERPE